MSTTRPVFGEPKPPAGPKSKKQYSTAPKQESLDFLAEKVAPLTGNFFQLPREIKLYIQSLSSAAAKDFVLELVDLTYGGQFTPDYGAAAKELAKPLRGKEYSRPRWAAFTVAGIAAISGSTESGATKFLADLESAGAIESRRAMGRIWYAANVERMVELTKPRQPKMCAPKPETTNIPHDLPKHECASGEPCLRARLAAELDGLPFGDDSQLVEKIRAAFSKSALEGGFAEKRSDLVQVSRNRKSALEGGFTPFTLVQKPGDASGVTTLSDTINGVNFVNTNGTLSHKRVRDEGGVLVIEELPPPTADDVTVGQWRKPVNAITRKYWHEVLGTSEIADIAGICEAIGATPEDWSRWAEDKCSRKCARNGGKMPAELRARLLVKFTTEDFQSYWLAAEAGEQIAAARPLSRTEQLFAQMRGQEGD